MLDDSFLSEMPGDLLGVGGGGWGGGLGCVGFWFWNDACVMGSKTNQYKCRFSKTSIKVESIIHMGLY